MASHTKRGWDDLAIFTGIPAFSQPLHVGRPNIGNRERLIERIHGVFDRRWLTNNGPLVQEFEAALAAYLGVKHCIAVCNGTVALEIAIRSLGLRGEVIVPSFTFIATAHALQWQQITPVFCDVDPKTHTLDPLMVEKRITPRTTGIVGVHLWGQPCAIDRLGRIAERHNLQLLFDASHAFGCSSGGKMIGNFGRVEVFSFHATKFFNTLEGGAVATNDDGLAKDIRSMKNFGFGPGYDNVLQIGTNGKMNELSAAMGLTGLENLSEFLAVNRRNYNAYRRGLRGISGIRLFEYNGSEDCNYQYVVLEIDADETGIARDELVRMLHAENVLARRYFHPGCHRMEPYATLFPEAGRNLPETEALSERVLVLPSGTAVGEEEADAICHLLKLAVANSNRLFRTAAGPLRLAARR